MCGIVGAIAQRDVAPILLEGLKRLEYRGYDSAGIAAITVDKQLNRLRTKGKVKKLAEALSQQVFPGKIGIAHTRWATHGSPSESNAHPHTSRNEIAIVHNGIIENYESLRTELLASDYQFSSETDTEIAAHLIHHHLSGGNDLLSAVRATADALEGAFSLGIIHSAEPDILLAIRKGSPLVIGIGIGEHFIASDHLALTPVAQQFVYLEDGDIAEIRRDSFQIFGANGNVVEREVITHNFQEDYADRAGYRHFMQKEIFEQPAAISATLEGRIDRHTLLDGLLGEGALKDFDKLERIQIVACGTSYNAGRVAQYWFESLAKIPCTVEIASEFRCRHPVVQDNTLFITISQSGETADTLAALRHAKERNYLTYLCICNVAESSLVRESDYTLLTRAGPEIGVASTKAFTTQLTALLLLCVYVMELCQSNVEKTTDIIRRCQSIPRIIDTVLALDTEIKQLAHQFIDKVHTLFLGRGVQFPIAAEGALKLKEISYIHAEAYPAGELKHGPLALVDEHMPVVAISPNDELLEKLKSNLQEVRARGGHLYVFAAETTGIQSDEQVTMIAMPDVASIIAPIIYTVPLQLLAYHVAVLKGTDVDQPRNLAKSVTVE